MWNIIFDGIGWIRELSGTVDGLKRGRTIAGVGAKIKIKKIFLK